MAIRSYKCQTCGEIELEQPISSESYETCPLCGDDIKRIIEAVPFRINGYSFANGYSKRDTTHD